MSSAAGLITICSIASTEPEERERARALVGADRFLDIDPQTLSLRDEEAAQQVCQLLEDRGFIRKDDRGTGGDGI
jgi:hypothetical protein